MSGRSKFSQSLFVSSFVCLFVVFCCSSLQPAVVPLLQIPVELASALETLGIARLKSRQCRAHSHNAHNACNYSKLAYTHENNNCVPNLLLTNLSKATTCISGSFSRVFCSAMGRLYAACCFLKPLDERMQITLPGLGKIRRFGEQPR